MLFTEIELNNGLEKIDQLLQNKKIPISGRTLAAICEFSKLYKIGLPVSAPGPGHPEEVNGRWYITEYIERWYASRYGERLKTYLGPGMCVFLLRGTPWIFKYPLFWGPFNYTVSKRKAVDYSIKDQKIKTHNILDFIVDFPEGLRESLSDFECYQLFNIFDFGLKPLMKLRDLKGNDLIKTAKSDIKASISHIMADQPDYGLSKWATLQATEKMIKYSLSKSNITFSKIHNLKKLVNQFGNNNFDVLLNNDLDAIQCNASVRYGEEEVTLQGAVKAYHSMFKVVNSLNL